MLNVKSQRRISQIDNYLYKPLFEIGGEKRIDVFKDGSKVVGTGKVRETWLGGRWKRKCKQTMHICKIKSLQSSFSLRKYFPSGASSPVMI